MIILNDKHYSKNMNIYHEIKSRQCKIITISNTIIDDNTIIIPYNKYYNDILSLLPIQLLAYHLSIKKGINPDMPRNLAKVVTV